MSLYKQNTIKQATEVSSIYPRYSVKQIIHEIDTAHPVDMRIANQGLVIYEHHNIFPEYFFISVPLFDDVVNSELEEWLYVMKYSEVRDDFKSPYMQKVAERLSILKMSIEERNTYFHYLKESVHTQDTLTAAKIEGKIEGKLEGKIEGEKIGIDKGEKTKTIEIAKNMLSKDMELSLITSITGLSKEEIEQLR